MSDPLFRNWGQTPESNTAAGTNPAQAAASCQSEWLSLRELTRQCRIAFMHLETVTVSRKSPGDGRLLISPTAFSALSAVGNSLMVRVDSHHTQGHLATLQCTCNKTGGAAGTAHTHHFVQADVIRELTPEAIVQLDLDGALLRITPPSRDE